MGMKEEEQELERIRRRKIEEMLRKASERSGRRGEPPSGASKPVELSDGSFAGFVRDNPIAVVDFWAPWCTPCSYVSPIIEEMAGRYAGRIAFGKLNVDENPGTAAQYGVMGIPTLLVFKKGVLVDRIVGAMERQSLEPRIAGHLQKASE